MLIITVNWRTTSYHFVRWASEHFGLVIVIINRKLATQMFRRLRAIFSEFSLERCHQNKIKLNPTSILKFSQKSKKECFIFNNWMTQNCPTIGAKTKSLQAKSQISFSLTSQLFNTMPRPNEPSHTYSSELERIIVLNPFNLISHRQNKLWGLPENHVVTWWALPL